MYTLNVMSVGRFTLSSCSLQSSYQVAFEVILLYLGLGICPNHKLQESMPCPHEIFILELGPEATCNRQHVVDFVVDFGMCSVCQVVLYLDKMTHLIAE